MMRVRPLFVVVAVAVVSSGCKETVYKDTPDTLAKLEACTKQLAAKDQTIDQLRADNANYQRQAAGEIVVVIEGTTVTVRSRRGGNTPSPIDDATAARQSQAFLDLISRSRGAIQKCYEQALKRNTSLQAVTITLNLSASFQASGQFNTMSTSRQLGDPFDGCLRGVASRWKLPAVPAPMTFQAKVSLSPT